MKEQLEKRLKELQAEFARGQHALIELDQRRHELDNTLQRLRGAILVLQEELNKADQQNTE